jgi:hypothetical protein
VKQSSSEKIVGVFVRSGEAIVEEGEMKFSGFQRPADPFTIFAEPKFGCSGKPNPTVRDWRTIARDSA